jgi:hypothetical protein
MTFMTYTITNVCYSLCTLYTRRNKIRSINSPANVNVKIPNSQENKTGLGSVNFCPEGGELLHLSSND